MTPEWHVYKSASNPYFKLMHGEEALMKAPWTGFFKSAHRCRSCDFGACALDPLFQHVLETGHLITLDLNE